MNIFKEEWNWLHLQDSTNKTELALNFSNISSFPNISAENHTTSFGLWAESKTVLND